MNAIQQLLYFTQKTLVGALGEGKTMKLSTFRYYQSYSQLNLMNRMAKYQHTFVIIRKIHNQAACSWFQEKPASQINPPSNTDFSIAVLDAHCTIDVYSTCLFNIKNISGITEQ